MMMMMRRAFLPLVLALWGSAVPAQPASAVLPGSLIVKVDRLEIQLVASPGTLRLYVRGEQPAVDLAHTRARLTLRAGADQQVVELQPTGDHLEAVGQFVVKPGTEVEALVATPGHPPATARFSIG